MTMAPAKQVRVLVVEDSVVMRELLIHVLSADPDVLVVGHAGTGMEAVEAVRRLRPDVVSMDLHMPEMNGMEATRIIMETHPTPIVIVSSSSAREEVSSAFRLLEAGALAVAEKPAGIGHPRHAGAARELIQTIKLMAEVKVVRRWARVESRGLATRPPEMASGRGQVELIAVGASTGGPLALKTILAGLPNDYPFPILMVQHIAQGFTEGLVEWLAGSSGFSVRIATDGECPLRGHAYIAPEGRHMKLGADRRIVLSADGAEHGHRPAVSVLFRSVADVLGRNAVGVLLSGMGRDGADELKQMKERGALTIAQDRQSSVVHGMPGQAIAIGGARQVLSPEQIAAALAALATDGARTKWSRP